MNDQSSLKKAIETGMTIASGPTASATLEKYVKDFLAQKFQVAILKTTDPETIDYLWRAITDERIMK
jgi:tartrate dehydratase beta subunit/fumarate hydratase class I family protein